MRNALRALLDWLRGRRPTSATSNALASSGSAGTPFRACAARAQIDPEFADALRLIGRAGIHGNEFLDAMRELLALTPPEYRYETLLTNVLLEEDRIRSLSSNAKQTNEHAELFLN